MAELSIDVQGIAETTRGLAQIGRGLRTELNHELLEIAGDVAGVSKGIAEQKGLRRTGKLIRSIKPGVRRGGAVVRVTAVREIGKKAPYKYPGVFEFGGRTGFGSVGPRAFLTPAAQEMREPSYLRVEALIDRLINRAGF